MRPPRQRPVPASCPAEIGSHFFLIVPSSLRLCANPASHTGCAPDGLGQGARAHGRPLRDPGAPSSAAAVPLPRGSWSSGGELNRSSGWLSALPTVKPRTAREAPGEGHPREHVRAALHGRRRSLPAAHEAGERVRREESPPTRPLQAGGLANYAASSLLRRRRSRMPVCRRGADLKRGPLPLAATRLRRRSRTPSPGGCPAGRTSS